MKKMLLMPLSAVLALATAGAADATVSYTFDSNNQGWTIGDVSTPIAAPGGAASWAGGRLTATDQSAETGVYAPGAVLGNQSGAYGNSISFDVSDEFNDGVAYPALVIYGVNGLAAAVSAGPPSTDNNALTSYSFVLDENVFSLFTGGNGLGGAITQSQFQSILGDIAGIVFRTEYKTGGDDSRFDNAVFNGFVDQTAPVPEPASWALMISGFGGVGGMLRRRRSVSKVSFA